MNLEEVSVERTNLIDKKKKSVRYDLGELKARQKRQAAPETTSICCSSRTLREANLVIRCLSPRDYKNEKLKQPSAAEICKTLQTQINLQSGDKRLAAEIRSC